MNFKINKSAAAVKESSGGSYISSSGIYDITIDFASLDVTKNGAESVNFNIEYNGNKQTIYGPYVQAGNGDPLDIGLALINKIFVIADAPEGEPNIEEEEHNVGKDNKPQDFAVFTDLSGIECKIRLQEEYSRYDGKITKRLAIKNFYTSDGASAEEYISGENIGKKLSQDMKYADNVTYRDSSKGANDAPTPEEVQAWKDEKAGKKPADSSAKAETKPAAKKRPTGGLFN